MARHQGRPADVQMFCGWAESVLWLESGPVSYGDLQLPADLAHALQAWEATWSSSVYPDAPSRRQRRAHRRTGRLLAPRVADCLGQQLLLELEDGRWFSRLLYRVLPGRVLPGRVLRRRGRRFRGRGTATVPAAAAFIADRLAETEANRRRMTELKASGGPLEWRAESPRGVLRTRHDGGMRIVGRLVAQERPVANFTLAHGDDPARALGRRGFALERPIRARLFDAEIELVVQVRPIEPQPDRTDAATIERDRGVSADAIPVVRQRIAAYALVTSDRGLLATEFSGTTRAEGLWGLPGGGIDAGEEPIDAVLREIVEESGQRAVLDDLVAVDSARWIGPNPHGTVEDYHAVRLIYRAHCPEPTEPVVLDVGGTTASARWVERDHWAELEWSAGWRRIVSDLLS